MVTIVAKAANVLSNPCTGDIKGPQRRTDTTHSDVSQSGKPRNERQGFSTNISSQRQEKSTGKYCLYCKVSSHDLETCRNLGAKNKIPTQAQLKQYPYLHHIQLPENDEDGGILIRNNIPKASEPLEVIHSEPDGPFALRTSLGWAVYGASKSDKSQRISAHHVSVQAEINQQLIDMFNQDFSYLSSLF